MEYPNPFWSSQVFKILIVLCQFNLQLYLNAILWCLSGPLVWQGSRRAPRRTSPGWTKPQQNRPSNLQVLCHIFTGQGAENSTGTTSDHWNSSICFWDSCQGGTDCNWLLWKTLSWYGLLWWHTEVCCCALFLTCVCWQSWTKASQTVFTKAVAHARQPDSTLATDASTTWTCRDGDSSCWDVDRQREETMVSHCNAVAFEEKHIQCQFMLPFNLISTCGSKHSRKSTIKSPIIQQWWSIRQKHLLAFRDRQIIHAFSMWATKKKPSFFPFRLGCLIGVLIICSLLLACHI